MARDRQRSKRRKRTSGGGGNPAGDRARDIGLDDATIDESGLTDTAPAPDPLKNASAEVDEAKAAGTGAGRGPAGEVDLGGRDVFADGDPVFADEDPGGRAPDELQEPGGIRGGRRGRSRDADAEADADLGYDAEADAAAAGTEAAATRSAAETHGGNRVVAFLRACIDELRRVQWPDRKHVFQATAVVLGFVLIAGGWLGLMDAIWQPLINAII